jgi:hypothetical protein
MTQRTHHTTALLSVFCAASFVACGNKPEPEPPPAKHVGPDDRILVVGKSWREMTQSEGFINEPDVAFMRVRDTFTLHLEQGASTALVDVDRDELLRSPDGREFHCKVAGAIKASVSFAWRMDEPVLSVRVPEASIPRKCKERGFTRPFKQLPALSASYALRGDQLVAIEPITLRSSLLPAD